jgi:hypothetical protein
MSSKMAGTVSPYYMVTIVTTIIVIFLDLLTWGITGNGTTPFYNEKPSGEISLKFQIDSQDFENLIFIVKNADTNEFDQHLHRALVSSLSTQGIHSNVPILFSCF